MKKIANIHIFIYLFALIDIVHFPYLPKCAVQVMTL